MTRIRETIHHFASEVSEAVSLKNIRHNIWFFLLLLGVFAVVLGTYGFMLAVENEVLAALAASCTFWFPGSLPHIRTRLYLRSLILFIPLTGEKARSILNSPSCKRADNSILGNGWEFSMNRIDDKTCTTFWKQT